MMAKPSGTADVSGFADIELEVWDGGGIYRAYRKKSRDVIGYLRYLLVDKESRVIRVLTTWTDPIYRGRKVGTALGERLHLDNPYHKLALGEPQAEGTEGRAFWDAQKAIQPDWDEAVVDKW